MSEVRFLSVLVGGKVVKGLLNSAITVLDLERKMFDLKTNPATSIFQEYEGRRWVDMEQAIGSPTRGGFDFMSDDDDGHVWFDCQHSVEVDDQGNSVTLDEMVDHGEASFAINLKEFTYYNQANGSWDAIK